MGIKTKIDLNKLSQYEVIENREVSDLNSYGYLLKHKKSGARVVILENDDNNKVFYIGFRTPPKDSTGVAHILEHSVLCGSEKFPTKDPFVYLCKSSLNTFLNAMTYPDKTVYPVASCNDKDFANLMHVYMDAVLKPNIYSEKKIFMQEGWHYELENPEDDITINGVVYNEMKGAFSSPDDVVDREILNSLFPDTAYGVESGGDPVNIPDLTYEDFLEFHSRYYHPSNSYIYLYGNADMVERLTWLDKEYLSNYDEITVDSFPGEQKAFDKAVTLEKYYPISDDENEEFNTYLSYNTVIGDASEKEKSIAFGIIDYALCDAQGSPLKQALIDAGIGNEIISTYENGIYQAYYSIVAKQANPQDKDDFVNLINEILAKVVKEGFDKNALRAGLNLKEFRYREADFGSTPKGLVYGLAAFDSWLYDDNKPFDAIECNSVYEFLNKMIDTDYYEKLLQECIIDNNHKTIITVLPKKGLTAVKDKELSDKLSQFKAGLTDDEIKNVIEETKALKEYQSAPDEEENIAKIPKLSIKDINPNIQKMVNEEVKFNNIDGLFHDVYTNGIAYVNLLFKVKDLPLSAYPYYSLLITMLGMLDTTNYSYEQLGYEINKKTGGFLTTKLFSVNKDDSEDYKSFAVFKFKTTYDHVADGFDLVKEILFNTKYDDYKRIKDILLEIKSQKASAFMNSGHMVALGRCNSYIRKTSKISEYMTGIDFYDFISDLLENFDTKKEAFVNELVKLFKFVFRKENLFVDLTSDNKGKEIVEKAMGDFADLLFTDEVEYPITKDEEITLSKDNEGITFSGRVQYVCRAGNYRNSGLTYNPSLKVLKTILSYDYLWNEVRVKGGSYGCMNGFYSNGNGFLVSYRDPNLKETNDIFNSIPEYIENFDVTEQEMTNYIISTIGELDVPYTPSSLGEVSLTSYLSNFTNEFLQEERNKIIATTANDIKSLAGHIRAILSEEAICVVGNDAKIAENKEMFKNIIPLIKG